MTDGDTSGRGSEREFKVGTVVEIKETGAKSVVVGFEQGRRTLQLPTGPGGATREFWRDSVERVEQPPLSRLYYIGRIDEREEIKDELREEIKNGVRKGMWGLFAEGTGEQQDDD